MNRLSSKDIREARQASQHLPSNDYDAAVLLAAITKSSKRKA